MTIQDQVVAALTIWRENRGGGTQGMQSVLNVIMNRVTKHGSDAFTECLRPKQFTSMTVMGPEAILWPSKANSEDWAMWQEALGLTTQEASGTLEDLTDGADLYYAPKGQTWAKRFTLPNGTVIPFPDDWNENAVTYTATIAGQVFFKG